jgi:hypothetical protein
VRSVELAAVRGFEEAQPVPRGRHFLQWEEAVAFNGSIRHFIKERL